MRFLRWCGRATVAVLQWMALFFVLANLAQVLRGDSFVFVRLYGTLIGSFVMTIWLRRRLRARRASKAALSQGREGVQ
jgi:hypothetical protein